MVESVSMKIAWIFETIYDSMLLSNIINYKIKHLYGCETCIAVAIIGVASVFLSWRMVFRNAISTSEWYNNIFVLCYEKVMSYG